MLSIRLLHNF